MSDMNSDPLFVGLTRPAMIFGVSIQFAIFNIMVSAIAFVVYSDFRILGLAFIFHVIGYILCFKEPRFLELYLNKFQYFGDCPNKVYYGAHSYKV